MDGDDAVEFFEKFSKEFGVDVTVLQQHWSEHFGPEGPVVPLGCLVVLGLAIVFGDLLHSYFRWGPAWAWMIPLILVFGWVYNTFILDHGDNGLTPVTVQELVEAAEAGMWVKHYSTNGGVQMFRMLD